MRREGFKVFKKKKIKVESKPEPIKYNQYCGPIKTRGSKIMIPMLDSFVQYIEKVLGQIRAGMF